MEPESGDSTDNPPLPEDSTGISQYIDNTGLHYQNYGVSRLSGRSTGLIRVTSHPVSSVEMAVALEHERSSVSVRMADLFNTEQAVLSQSDEDPASNWLEDMLRGVQQVEGKVHSRQEVPVDSE
jgi:hypothetical protein